MFPLDWQQAWDDAQPRLHALHESWLNTPVASSVARISQLDADSLDDELVRMLLEPLIKAGDLLNSALRARFAPELVLAVRVLLYKLSVWDTAASYGAKLQGLRYHIARHTGFFAGRVLVAHFALYIITPYLHERVRGYALSHAWPDAPSSSRNGRLWTLLKRLETIHTLLALLNFSAFLLNGRHHTLTDRLLSLRLVQSQRFTNREVSYEFMNRQMVWHAFTEFILFLLPLIQMPAARRIFRKICNGPSGLVTIWKSTDTSEMQERRVARRGKYQLLPDHQCAICFERSGLLFSSGSEFAAPSKPVVVLAEPSNDADVVNEPSLFEINVAYTTSCGHAYCYYCVSDRVLRATNDGEDGWECLRCMQPVRTLKRVYKEAPVAETAESDSDIEELPSFTSDMSIDDESQSSAFR